MNYDNYVIEWYELHEAFLYDTNSMVYRLKQFNVASHKKFCQKIVRGYKDKSTLDDKPVSITHICFVVHGIGQRLAGHINRQCCKLKRSCRKVLKKHYSAEARNRFRIEFLPIEWRTNLNLDGGIIDSITPKEFKGLRTIFNNTVMDILYYSSNLYQIEIAHGVQSELNRIYSMFCARNPYFEDKGGKVSIIAHSLGSVICYDIISSWGSTGIISSPPLSIMNDCCGNSEECKLKLINGNMAPNMNHRNCDKWKNMLDFYQVKLPKEGFKKPNFPSNFKTGDLWKEVNHIENFFMLGSPLPVFLALRGFRPENIQDEYDILPKNACKKMFNIYHNSDPVAYRIEPLLFKEYFYVDPTHIKNTPSETQVKHNGKKLKNATFSTSNLQTINTIYDETSTDSENGDIDDVSIPDGPSNHIKYRIAETFRKLSRATTNLPAVDELQLKFKSLKDYSVLTRFKVFLNILKGKDTEEDKNSKINGQSEYRKNYKMRQRLDYTLGEENGIGSYLSLLTSHTSYWEDMNLAKFLIDQVIKSES